MKILWIDDDAYDLKYLLHNLQAHNYTVEHVNNLPQAYNILKERSNEFDLIVLDLLMPRTDKYGQVPEWLFYNMPHGENGIVLLKRIREEISAKIIVVILSIVGAGVIRNLNLEQYHPVEVIRKTPNNIKRIEEKIIEIMQLGINSEQTVAISE